MLARSGLMTPPCGVPVWLRFPPLIRRFPFSSRSSTATFSHLFTSFSIHRSTTLLQAPSPLPEPRRLDVLEALPVPAGRPAVLLGEPVSVREHVLSVHLVVELVEAERRLLLRLRVELPLEVPDLFRSLQAHANPLTLLSFRSAPEVRPLPSTGVDRLRGYCEPLRRPAGPSPTAPS